MMDYELNIDGRKIEAAWYGPKADRALTLVLLHEGLGSVSMWRDFPVKLTERTGCGVFAYSRFGYGKSDPVTLPRRLSYMHDEAFLILPKVLDAAMIKKAILVGHSDGASIATIYAGGLQDFRVRGLVLMAPHFFIEDVSIRSIEAAKVAYESTDLRQRLAKYHADVDNAFRGWNDAWLDPRFREWRIEDALAHVRVPMLLIQGEKDEYGTLAQIELAQAESYCPADALVLPDCRHSPHIDQPEATLRGIDEFVRRVMMHEGLVTAA